MKFSGKKNCVFDKKHGTLFPVSLLGFRWHLPKNPHLTTWQQILASRNLTEADFERMKIERPLHDPYLFEDMERAVERLVQAKERGDRVVVFGDYDADGVTATATILHFLKIAGISASYRIPNRIEHGYGMKKHFVDELAEKGVNLIITVDNGAVAFDEIAHAKALGIDVIVTDHHAFQGENPEAIAMINPKVPGCNYPFSGVSGSILAWKLALAAAPALGVDLEKVRDLLAFAVIGLIADCCPLIDENRTLVIEGLKLLEQTKYTGLRALLKQAGLDGKPLLAENVAFQLGPRINAAGRLDTAYHALDLLLGKEQNAHLLEQMNQERRAMVEEGIEEAEKIIASLGEKRLLLLKNEKWHPGIIGLIAGKMTEKYGFPSIALTKKGGEFVASCRSPEGFDLFAPLSELKHHFLHFGGHRQAAGFSLSVEKWEEFQAAAHDLFEPQIAAANLAPFIRIDAELSQQDATIDFFEQMQSLAPFGMGNEEPVFRITGRLSDVAVIGSEGTHLRGKVNNIPFIAFSWGKHHPVLSKMEEIEAAGTLSLNEFQGKKSIQFRLIDIAKSA